MADVTVCGVDGCRGGWAVATLRGDRVSVRVEPRIAPVIDATVRGEVAAVAIDMPIGLPDDGDRACDRWARALLGPRRSSVFPTPPRPCLGAADHDAASDAAAVCTGRRLSVQSFHLLPRIAELDAAMTPAYQEQVVEAHPELAFARLAGAPMSHPKRTAAGRAERLEVLAEHGLTAPRAAVGRAAADDVLDAVVLALVARAVAGGHAERLGDCTRDARGLRMEIVSLPERGPG
jgi:predicted RNase H-like nuclease